MYISHGNNMRLKRLNKDGEKGWIVGGPPSGMNDQDRLFCLPAGMAVAVPEPRRRLLRVKREDE